jgi:hypothetical protein
MSAKKSSLLLHGPCSHCAQPSGSRSLGGTHVGHQADVLRQHILEQHVLHNVSAWGYTLATAQHVP